MAMSAKEKFDVMDDYVQESIHVHKFVSLMKQVLYSTGAKRGLFPRRL